MATERTYQLSTEESRVYQAVAALETTGEPVYVDRIVRTSGLSREQTHHALHSLLNEHKLLHELTGVDDPDLGPRYELTPKG